MNWTHLLISTTVHNYIVAMLPTSKFKTNPQSKMNFDERISMLQIHWIPARTNKFEWIRPLKSTNNKRCVAATLSIFGSNAHPQTQDELQYRTAMFQMQPKHLEFKPLSQINEEPDPIWSDLGKVLLAGCINIISQMTNQHSEMFTAVDIWFQNKILGPKQIQWANCRAYKSLRSTKIQNFKSIHLLKYTKINNSFVATLPNLNFKSCSQNERGLQRGEFHTSNSWKSTTNNINNLKTTHLLRCTKLWNSFAHCCQHLLAKQTRKSQMKFNKRTSMLRTH